VTNKNAPGATDALPSPLLHSHVAEGQQLQNLNGISDLSQSEVNAAFFGFPPAQPNGFEVTPPDQGLCVGTDPLTGTTQVFEIVNESIRETNPDGSVAPSSLLGDVNPVTGEVPLQFFFAPTAFAFGDPRCFFDKSTGTFFFTELGILQSGPDAGFTSVDVATFNGNAGIFDVQQFDTSESASCFGDQPHVGLDNDNLVVTTDQFCDTGYLGALLLAISKSQLVFHQPALSAEFDNISLGSVPLTTLQPVVSTDSTGTEYLVNAFPYDQFGNNNTLSNFLGFWHLDNGEGVTDGDFAEVTLSGKVIRSETYGFPVPAASTGDGSVTSVFVPNLGFSIPVLSEQFLDAGDSRMMQCQLVHGAVWCSLDTAVSISHDPSTRDGIAWFKIDPKAGRVSKQGRIDSTGNYLLYPAITVTREGTVAITFSITSPPIATANGTLLINPSAAYVIRKAGHTSFGSIHITALGTDPHQSFAFIFGRVRWGDYSAEALDPNGKDIWGATEWIPQPVDQDAIDNWGTNVFEIMGDH